MRERLPSAARLVRRGLGDLWLAVGILTGRVVDLGSAGPEVAGPEDPWVMERRRDAYRATWEAALRDDADPEMRATVRSALKALQERQVRAARATN